MERREPGLFAYLRALLGQNGDGRRDVIANVFRGIQNRMISGYLLRDVVNLIDGIHFNAAEEIHTLGHLYESMLREMRDTAGDSGEFYTPRPVVRFMVEVTDPRLGEVVLDPACGTGGFLSESYGHLEKQCKTVQDMKVLQEKSIFGGEAKPLPYMLAQMNLLLHGLKSPQIAYGNSLAGKLTEIGKRDRVDVILTNPPFGGEEEAGIRTNFPADKQTSETALLFLQLIMRKLRRAGEGSAKGGRAGVVVPNAVLSAGGVTSRIRHDLLAEYNLHTIVRLPHNVFAPYTDLATNLLFFDSTGSTKRILFCEVPLPSGTTLSKTKPLEYDQLQPFLKVIRSHKETQHSWYVDVSALSADLDLDIRNPRINVSALPPATTLLKALRDDMEQVRHDLHQLHRRLESIQDKLQGSSLTSIGSVTHERDERVGARYSPAMRLIGVTNSGGISPPKTKIGKAPDKYKLVAIGDLVYNPMRINIGSVGIALTEDQTGITSPDYVVFACNEGLLPEYVYHFLKSEWGRHAIRRKTRGSVRFRLYYDRLAEIEIPVPTCHKVQQEFVELCRELGSIEARFSSAQGTVKDSIASLCTEAFSIIEE